MAAIPLIVILAAPMSVASGQSSVAVSPFVSYVPSAARNPMAGMALTFGGTTGLALRGSADLSISNPRTTDPASVGGGNRPWGADADGILFLNGLGGGATVFSRTLSPYVFAGIGMTGGDSAGTNVVRNGWSYGAGATIPLGLHADIFGEARWRMPEYVLPTSDGAPDSRSEFRFGLSFHVGGSEPERPRRRGRHYRDDDYADVVQQPVPVVAAAPAPQVIVVPQAAPPPPPQTVIVTPAPAPQPAVIVMPAEPQPRTEINVNLPGSGRSSSRRSRHPRYEQVVVVQPQRAGGVEPRRSSATVTCPSGTTARRSSNNTVVCVAQRRR